MKKLVILPLLLLAICMLAAVESEPSNVVGYVKYSMIAGNNVVAIPMDAGFVLASDIADFYGASDAVNYFGTDELWHTAYNDGWDWWDDFPVQPGSCVMLYSFGEDPFFSIGTIPTSHAIYNLIEGNNVVMIPLNRSDLTMAGEVGDEIVTDAVNYFGTDELWHTAYFDGWDWWDDFDISIGMPLMVYSSADSVWPSRAVQKTELKSASNN